MAKVVLWIQNVLLPMLGPAGLFVVAFFDSSFLSLPEINDILVVTSCSLRPGAAWLPITMATLGSLAGCTVLWEIGRRGGEPLLERRFGKAQVARTRAAFERWDLLALIVPALLPPPMPFKIFVLSAGVFGVPWKRFAATLILARGLRYVFWGLMGIFFGDEALEMLRGVDRWFDDHGVAVLLVVAGAILAGVAVWAVRRRGRPVPPAPGSH
jgi:membrane protein YqaA with SNARE-associated domain